MAKRVLYQLVDDLDGRVLADGAGETVRFSLDGTDFVIDLSREHAAELRSLLQPYKAAGRTAPRPKRKPARGTSGPQDLAAVRRWARANGLDVADKGRIPRHVIESYQKEQP